METKDKMNVCCLICVRLIQRSQRTEEAYLETINKTVRCIVAFHKVQRMNRNRHVRSSSPETKTPSSLVNAPSIYCFLLLW
jgi:hypothetical protein